jgi:hypothetical protein
MGECSIPPPFLTLTLDEEFFLLTSCGARMTDRQFKLAPRGTRLKRLKVYLIQIDP